MGGELGLHNRAGPRLTVDLLKRRLANDADSKDRGVGRACQRGARLVTTKE